MRVLIGAHTLLFYGLNRHTKVYTCARITKYKNKNILSLKYNVYGAPLKYFWPSNIFIIVSFTKYQRRLRKYLIMQYII